MIGESGGQIHDHVALPVFLDTVAVAFLCHKETLGSVNDLSGIIIPLGIISPIPIDHFCDPFSMAFFILEEIQKCQSCKFFPIGFECRIGKAKKRRSTLSFRKIAKISLKDLFL